VKHLYISSSLHGAISYMMTFRVTTMETSHQTHSKFPTSVKQKDGHTCVRYQVLTVVLQFCNVTLCCLARSRWHWNGSLCVLLDQAAFLNCLPIQMKT